MLVRQSRVRCERRYLFPVPSPSREKARLRVFYFNAVAKVRNPHPPLTLATLYLVFCPLRERARRGGRLMRPKDLILWER